MKAKIEMSAGGIVYKKKGKKTLWLITQHSQHKGWVFPKGLVGDEEKNESPQQAALREVEEEGGIKAKIVNHQPVETHYTYRWPADTAGEEETLVKKTVFYFLMEYISGDPADHDWEMMDAKFVVAEEVIKTLTYESDKKAFEEIQKLL